MKAKIKMIKDKLCTQFYGKGMPKKCNILVFAIEYFRLYYQNK